ncbi:MAG: hypothetical protein LQ346_003793 [Caloplaca aetnensis]|nr:MAG: hypothetical protein LQ346_003793 [Caloplaca aetnensis]
MAAPHNIPLEQRDVEKAVSPGVGEDNNRRKQKRPGQVVVPQAKPINDTWWRRHLTLLAVAVSRRLPSRRGVAVLRIPGNRFCVKYGDLRDFSEAHAIQFIGKHTSIPVPKIYCAFERKGCTYIVMEFIRAYMVAYGWTTRSEESKGKIMSQLRSMTDEMRRIPRPAGLGIANVCGGSLFDGRLPGPLRFGPFKTTDDFHLHVREGWDRERCQALPPIPGDEIRDLLRQHDGTWPVCFTHGDLSSLNILTRGDEVVGIIDWETAGWYPSYWEYTNAWHVNPWNEFWQEEVGKFLEPLPQELAMEQTRRKYFKDF